MKKLQRLQAPKITNENVKHLDPDYERDMEKAEFWGNDIYQVEVRRDIPVPALKDQEGNPLLLTWLSIKRHDKRAMTDWRHFQWIKNELVGEDCEGMELYPAEERLVDGANQYHLWVFQDNNFRFPWGWNYRLVTESQFVGQTQRKFPMSRRPKDIEENERKMELIIEESKQKNNGA